MSHNSDSYHLVTALVDLSLVSSDLVSHKFPYTGQLLIRLRHQQTSPWLLSLFVEDSQRRYVPPLGLSIILSLQLVCRIQIATLVRWFQSLDDFRSVLLFVRINDLFDNLFFLLDFLWLFLLSRLVLSRWKLLWLLRRRFGTLVIARDFFFYGFSTKHWSLDGLYSFVNIGGLPSNCSQTLVVIELGKRLFFSDSFTHLLLLHY